MEYREISALTQSSEAHATDIVGLLRTTAEMKPEATVYTFLADGETDQPDSICFEELDLRARAIAVRLSAIAEPGARAVLLYPPGLDFIAAFFGCLYAGVIAVPAYPSSHRHRGRLMAIIADASPTVIMTTESLAERFGNESTDYTLQTSSSGGGRNTPCRLCTDGISSETAEQWRPPLLTRESLAFLQYTSGSTGDPKGVMVSHGNLMANQEAIKQSFEHTGDMLVVGWLPLYHDMGLIGNILQPLYLSSSAVLMSPMAFLAKPVRWLKAISDYQATTSGGPNFAYDLCVRKISAEQKRDLDLTSWTLAFNGSEPIRGGTMERFLRAFSGAGFRRESFFPCYGLAEATLFVAGTRLQTAQPGEDLNNLDSNVSPVSCGFTPAKHTVHIVHPETDEPVADGEVGEIWVSGPSVTRGYWNQLEKSDKTFGVPFERGCFAAGEDDDGCERSTDGRFGCLRTGDLGFVNEGQLHVTGRIKELIIVRGRNHYPHDIEQALTDDVDHLRPGCCAAFAVTEEGSEGVVVVAEVDREILRRNAFEPIITAMHLRLAETFDLAATDLVLVQPGIVPKTSSGKIRRGACKQAYLDATLSVVACSSKQDRTPSCVADNVTVEAMARSGSDTVHRGSVGTTLEAQSEPASLPEDKRVDAPSQERAMEFQLLQEALNVVPAAQRAALVVRFVRTKTSQLLGINETALSPDLPLRSWGLDSLRLVEVKHTIDQLLNIESPFSLFFSDRPLFEVVEVLVGDSEALDCTDHGRSGKPTNSGVQSEGDVHPPEVTTYSLSCSQHAMWAVHQMETDHVGYNLHLGLTIEGPVDVPRLQQAFQHLADRHPVLRTVYRTEKDTPIQCVSPSVRIADGFSLVDAAGWSEAKLQIHMAQRIREPFDLTLGPLFRVTLYQPDADVSAPKHTLLFCIHHTVADLWSVLILVDDLYTIYTQLAHSGQLALECPAVDYAAFIAWQQHYMRSPVSEKDWDYWHQQLEGNLPILALPTDRPRVMTREYHGASTTVALKRQITDHLKNLAREQGVTLFTVLLAAYTVLLHRHTGQRELVVGVPTSGRSQARFASVVGNFINTFPLRSHPVGGKPFITYLAEVNHGVLGALAHQDFPFPLMVERLQPERSIGHWPIYQTLFVLQQAQAGIDSLLAQLGLGEDGASWAWGDWKAQPVKVRQRVENFDLKLMAAETEEGLLFSFQYDSDLFELATVKRLSHHFKELIRGIVANPERPLGDLPLLPAEELRRVLGEWNATEVLMPVSGDGTLHQLIETQVIKSPDAIAVLYQEGQITYRELNRLSNHLAHALISTGIKPDTLVGICARRSLELIVGLLGIVKAGGAYLPLDPDDPTERRSVILGDTSVTLILAQPEFVDTFPDFAGKIWTVDHELTDFAEHSDRNPSVRVDGEMLAYVLFTSGSTGHPKGVGIPHKGIRNRLLWMQDRFRLDATDAVLQKTPYTFDVSVWELFWPLISGARLVMAAAEDHKEPERLVDLIERHAITTLHFVPPMLGAFLDVADLNRCTTMRRVICSGEALNPDLRDRFFLQSSAELHNLYGPTEASIDVTAYYCDRDRTDASVPIGRPIVNTQLYILDRRFNPVPVGGAGELYIGGVQLARGYLNRPDLTAGQFLPDPFGAAGERLYRTGDLARYRPDGVIEYLDRIDQQVKIRGFRIELGEIETRLRQHKNVREAVVLVQEENLGDKRLVAYFVSHRESMPETDELRMWLGIVLPEYMIPTALVHLERLPMTSNGKLDRSALPSPNFSERFTAHYVAPRNTAEETLATIWAEVLRLERVGIHDNFFELGGDSILSIQAVSRATRAGYRLSSRQLFQHQTVAKLATVFGETRTTVIDQGAISGDIPLAPIQYRFFQQNFSNPHHWNQAVLLEVKKPLESDVVERAMEYLVSHHDALRLRFLNEKGEWRQTGLAKESHSFFEKVDLNSVLDVNRAGAIEAECSLRQASLNLNDGPLVRGVWFDAGGKQNPRLLIVIHHLAVDGVSWRILLEDLASACSQLSKGEAVALPPKTTSFKRWAEELQTVSQSGALRSEMKYWHDTLAVVNVSLPVDYPNEPHCEGDVSSYIVKLGTEDTSALLREVPTTYRATVEAILLAALVEAVCDWCGGDSVVIDLESHGREALLENLDLSRTVGWFTSLYPVVLRLLENASPDAAIQAIKEELGRIPQKGIGYGLLRQSDLPPTATQDATQLDRQILFNYLGQFDQVLDDAPWVLAPEWPGIYRDPNNRRSYELEIDAHVTGGRLQVAWRFSTGRYRRETIARLAEHFIAALQKIIAYRHCRQAGSITPTDFPLARLDSEALNALPYDPRDIEDIYPLAPMQEGMLFDTLMAPRSGIYLMQDRFELCGDIDESLFRQACQQVVDRHPALRTSFLWETSTRPCQIVHRSIELPFDYQDWRAIPDAKQATRLERLLAEERQQGFDFLDPPLMIIRLFRLGDSRYRLVRSYHHILIDAWCMSLMLVELRDNYEILSRGDTPDQPQAPGFGNYIGWLQNQLNGPAEQYWRQYLGGVRTATPFHVDRQMMTGDESDIVVGDTIVLLSKGDTERLNALAQQHRLTPNTFAQAAWALMLSRYSGHREVVFGVTVSGRPADLPGSEEMLGVFINTLPLRVDVRPDQSLLDFMQGLLQRNADIRQYEHVPLVQIQSWSELPQEQPLFESLLVFENYPVDPSLRSGGKIFDIVNVDTRTHTNYPLTGMVIPGDQFHLQMTFQTSRFDGAVVENMLGHFKNLLVDMIRSTDKRLEEIVMLGEQEQHQMVVDWNRTAKTYPGPEDFVACFSAQVARSPEAPAVLCRGVHLTYGELKGRATRMANALSARGVGPEIIVAVVAERGVAFLSTLLAIFEAGGVYLPLDPSHPDGRLAQLLMDSGPAMVIVDSASVERLRKMEISELEIVTADELLNNGDAQLTLGSRGTPHSLAYIIHTSGSTGEPKGVMVERTGMLNNLLTKIPALALGAEDIIAQTASQCFDISVWQLLTPLLCGAKVSIYPDEVAHDPGRLLETVARDKVTILESVPSLIRAMLDERMVTLPQLRWLLPTGEALPADLCRRWMERYPHTRLLNAYGPAECSDDVAYYPVPQKPTPGESSIPIGRPVDNLRLHILDDRMKTVPVGVPGELCVAGIGVGRGYLGKPAMTAAAFVPDPFTEQVGRRLYRTGDLACFQPDGNIVYLGRIDDQVKIRGFRIELGEIEAHLRQDSRVRDVAVVIQESGSGDKRIVAYVVRRDPKQPGSHLTDSLRGTLVEILPRYMVPAAFVVLESLPLTPNGKVDRKKLSPPDFTSSSIMEPAPPRNPTERALITIWRDVLEIDRFGIHDNFFELGGHSLLVIRVVAKLRFAFDVEIPLPKLFESPTVAELAEQVESLLLAKLETLSEEEAQSLLAPVDSSKTTDPTVSEGLVS